MKEEVKKAVEVLQNGSTLLYPTDTIWGIGCDATNEQAVNKIYKIKERDPSKSMLILAADINMVDRYVDQLEDLAEQLFEESTKALTLILPDARNLASNLPALDGSIGIRIPDDPFCQALLQSFRRPIVSTSANLSGEPSPGCFTDISEELKKRVDYTVNWRQEEAASQVASSIVFLGRGGLIKVIRE